MGGYREKAWFVILSFALVFIETAKGGFENPFLALPGNEYDDDIDIFENSTIRVCENVGDPANKFNMATILVGPSGTANLIGTSPHFTVEKVGNSYFLVATRAFDYERDPAELQVILQDETGATKPVRIYICNLNDNSPELVDIRALLSPVPELTTITEVVTQVIATDPDGDALTFQIKGGDVTNSFEINNQGEIRLQSGKQLVYAESLSHRLEIVVNDGDISHDLEVPVTILVGDIPNLPPIFTKPPIIRSVEEEIADGTQIIQVVARDGDFGLNWPILYYLEEPLDFFDINLNSGAITVKARIDAESPELRALELQYSLTVIAREDYDPAQFPGLDPSITEVRETVDFVIDDINDEAPLFCTENDAETCVDSANFAFEIPETFLGTITTLDKALIVEDKDYTSSFNTYTATISATAPPFVQAAFSITPTEGSARTVFSLVARDSEALDFENGNWHDNVGNPKDVSFEIEFKGVANPSHVAKATVTARVTDVNDNEPRFTPVQYEFYVCENGVEGAPLQSRTKVDEAGLDTCANSVAGEDIVVGATDSDVTPAFGQPSVRYRWSSTTREPPLELDPETGAITVKDEVNFDYERFPDEFFVVEAVDSDGAVSPDTRSSSAVIHFKVLDRNDMAVDIQITDPKGARFPLPERTAVDTTILSEIVITDVDLTADLTLDLSVNRLLTASGQVYTFDNATSLYRNEVSAVDDWFKVEISGGEQTENRKGFVMKVQTEPDREGGEGGTDIDRVDLTLTATDFGTDPEYEDKAKTRTQVVSITITDVNDNPPQWAEGEDYSSPFTVQEVNWGDEEDGSSEYSREIKIIRATDRDLDTEFQFTLSNHPDCEETFNKTICEKMLTLVEMKQDANVKLGKAIIVRPKGVVIDREARHFFFDDTDMLRYTLTVRDTDGKNELSSEIHIWVDDINDNDPYFDEIEEDAYVVNELATDREFIIARIHAMDDDRPDRFGNVTYLLESEIGDPNVDFIINTETNGGVITPKLSGIYEWSEKSEYDIPVKAIDYYRPSVPYDSRSTVQYIKIRVIDENNHAPDFQTSTEDPLSTINERDLAPGDEFEEKILLRDLDDPSKPNGQIEVALLTVERVPDGYLDDLDPSDFFDLAALREGTGGQKELAVVAKVNFTRAWGTYRLNIQAFDGEDSKPERLFNNDTWYEIVVKNENLHAPEFVYPTDNSTEVYVSIETSAPFEPIFDNKTNKPLPDIEAEDIDNPELGNGVVVYELITYDEGGDPPIDCSDAFILDTVVEPTKARILLKRYLDPEADNWRRCNLRIMARDNAQDEADRQYTFASMKLSLIGEKNTPPAFSTRTFVVPMTENTTTPESGSVDPAIDPDVEDPGHPVYGDDKIFYVIVGGDMDHFTLNFDSQGDPHVDPVLVANGILDYEETKEYRLTVYATNRREDTGTPTEPDDVDPADHQYIVLIVTVIDIKDTAPIFTEGDLVTGGFSRRSEVSSSVSLMTVYDPDEDDPVDITITSDFSRSAGSNLPAPKPDLPPFELRKTVDDKTTRVEVVILFVPQPSYSGYYSFQITAEDSIGMKATTEVQLYMIRDAEILLFYFYNQMEEISEKQLILTSILTEFSGSRGNVDKVYEDNAQNGITVAETHFIDVATRKAVPSSAVRTRLYSVPVYDPFQKKLIENDIRLTVDGIGGPQPQPDNADSKTITIYILVGGVAVLAVTLAIIGATCFYNNRSLSRRVRALTATTFGSQQSDLNRIGATTMDAPNTNNFAVEGSNPMWSTGGDEPTKYNFDFDTQSIGSGGSVLIGAEDEDYFHNKGGRNNPVFEENDVVANFDSDNDYGDDDRGYGGASPSYPGSHRGADDDESRNESPFPTKVSRNPLMNMGGGGGGGFDFENDDGGDDYDEEDPNPEMYFEGNTDSALF